MASFIATAWRSAAVASTRLTASIDLYIAEISSDENNPRVQMWPSLSNASSSAAPSAAAGPPERSAASAGTAPPASASAAVLATVNPAPATRASRLAASSAPRSPRPRGRRSRRRARARHAAAPRRFRCAVARAARTKRLVFGASAAALPAVAVKSNSREGHAALALKYSFLLQRPVSLP